MGMFDQNGRQAAKLDGPGFVAWLLRRFTPLPPLAFDRWDDTRRTSWAGGPDRTDDLVAVLRRTDRDGRAYLIVEIETEPERHIFQRLGVYALMLSMETSANFPPGDEPDVGCVLLHLTGERAMAELRLTVPGTDRGTIVSPIVIDLRREDAAATLADIDAGLVALCILVWVPLMRGGGEPALIEEWKRVVMKETSAEKRALYRDLALVFAELIKGLVNWQHALEGWEMKESQLILSWLREGKERGVMEAHRADVIELIRLRFQDPVPEPLRLAIEGTNDTDILRRWHRAAATSKTIEELRKEMKQDK